MTLSEFIVALAGLAIAGAPALAETKAQPAASIAFAATDGIRNWTAVGDQTLYFQDRRGDWYRAELSGPSYDLAASPTIAIKADVTGRLDRWGAVYIRGIRYDFRSFEKAPGPPPSEKPAQAD